MVTKALECIVLELGKWTRRTDGQQLHSMLPISGNNKPLLYLLAKEIGLLKQCNNKYTLVI